MWGKLKGWFGGGAVGPKAQGERGERGEPAMPAEYPRVDESESPWGVSLLDVRPFTQNVTAASSDPTCAANAASMSNDDGLDFAAESAEGALEVDAGLVYRVGGHLADGVLFSPAQMEDKWALFLHGGRVLCVRSWQRKIMLEGKVELASGRAIVGPLRGVLFGGGEDPSYLVRAFDFLMRSHALGEDYPAPLPSPPGDPRGAAVLCFSLFGRKARFASHRAPSPDVPATPLRTDSLLHIAIARGDRDLAAAQLEGGTPIDLLARDGLSTLHWALASNDEGMLEWLLERGAPADARSLEGATPLMNAVQAGSLGALVVLLEHGADVNARDARGFTALHRAAESGHVAIVTTLLERGADVAAEAQGFNALALALKHGHDAVARLVGG